MPMPGQQATENGTLDSDRKTKRSYVCRTCKKSFKRREHCARHERGHTKEKPYLCRYCRRSYARRDLVTRHEKSLHADQWSAPTRASRTATTETVYDNGSNGSNEQDDMVTPLERAAEGVQHSPHRAGSNDVTNGRIGNNVSGIPFGEILMAASPPNLSDFTNGMDNMALLSPSHDETGANGLDAFANLSQLQYQHFQSEFAPSANFSVLEPSSLADNPHFAQNGGVSQHRNSFVESLSLPLQSPNDAMMGSTFPTYNWGDVGAMNGDSPLSSGRINSKIPALELDDAAHACLVRDMDGRLAPHLRARFQLPSRNILDRFLNSYLTCFHDHFPIVHVASLNLSTVPAPVVLAMCAIGALFRLERKHAIKLRDSVDQALASEKLNNPTIGILTAWPTWMAQCKLLSLYAALFAGDLFTITLGLQSMGSLTTEYRHRRVSLANPQEPRDGPITWSEWVEKETSKRILYGTFVLNNLVCITYGTTPRMSIVPDSDIDMPDDERLWDSTTETQWADNMVMLGPSSQMTLRAALNQVIAGRGAELEASAMLKWSSFASTIIMHAMNIYIWHIVQSAQAFVEADGVAGHIHTTLLRQAERSLARCSDIFLGGNPETEQRLNELAASRRSNCVALLRTAYVKAASAEYCFDRVLVLGADSPAVTRTELQLYVASEQPRNDFVTKAVKWAYHGLATSVKAGPLLVKKTAAFKWSLDHAIADWDCVLFVSRWIYTIERQQHVKPPDASEAQNLAEMRELLTDIDTDVDVSGKSSLAAEVTRVWAGFMDDTWVWGITPRMGAVMRQLADEYDLAWQGRDPRIG